MFFGGTALARTWLTDPANGGRLSEDIDLYTEQRQDVAQLLTHQLPIMLRREFPGASWQPSLDTVRSTEPARLASRDGLEMRIQLLSTSHHRELAAWPTGSDGSLVALLGPRRRHAPRAHVDRVRRHENRGMDGPRHRA